MQSPAHSPTDSTAPVDPADDHRRRRLAFRANHRGTKENDLLLGGFVSARLAAFSAAEIDALELILDLADPELAEWLSGRMPIPDTLEPATVPDMLHRIRAAALAGPA